MRTAHATNTHPHQREGGNGKELGPVEGLSASEGAADCGSHQQAGTAELGAECNQDRDCRAGWQWEH